MASPSSSPIDPATPATSHVCLACHLVFPEHMMKRDGEHWYCLACNVTHADADAARQERLRASAGAGFLGIPTWLWVVGSVLIAALYIIPRWGGKRQSSSSSGFPGLVSEAAEPWSKEPAAQWPQFTLVNDFELQGRPKAAGGPGFLLDTGDGHVLGVTPSRREALAKKADESSTTIAELNQRFVSWRMSVFGAPDRTIAFQGFFGAPTGSGDGDIWLLRPQDDKATRPATPLKIRHMVSFRGMRLFVIARAAGDTSGQEHAFPCTAQDVGATGELAEIAYDSAVVSKGFAGSPVVDAQGHLAAIVIGVGDEEMSENGSVTWLKVIGTGALQRLMK